MGNGPSLKRTPLELLRGEVSYATNAIHLLYNHTQWRPTHLVIADVTAAHRDWVFEGGFNRNDDRTDRFLQIVDANSNIPIHIREGYKSWVGRLLGIQRNIDFFPVCSHHSMGIDDNLEDKAPVEWHLPEVCRWGGSVLMAIQLAASAGYEPLYLVGCDLGYNWGKSNHFTYEYDEPIDRAKADALNMVMKHAHELASVSWDIYNAGLWGELNAYLRVTLEELFQ